MKDSILKGGLLFIRSLFNNGLTIKNMILLKPLYLCKNCKKRYQNKKINSQLSIHQNYKGKIISQTQEEFQMEPEKNLEVKEWKLHRWTVREVMVQWKGYPIEDASWED